MAPQLDYRMADRQSSHSSATLLSAQETLEEQQRLQAVLLQVALRTYPTDISRLAKAGLAVPWADAQPPNPTPYVPPLKSANQRSHNRQESPARSTDTSLPSSFLATLRGQTPPLTPRRPVQMEPSHAAPGDSLSTVLNRWCIGDIMLGEPSAKQCTASSYREPFSQK